MNEHLSVHQAAARLGVSVDTLRDWEKAGRVKAERTVGGHRRFLASEIERVRAKLGAMRPGTGGQTEGRAPQNPQASALSRTMGLPGLGPPTFWQEQVREVRARTDVLKARREARELLATRQASQARAIEAAEDAKRREEHRQQLETLKEFGRSLARAELPAEWRAQVTQELERFVTPDRFPPSLPASEGRAFVEARVQAVVRRYQEHRAEERAREERARQRELDAVRVERLVESGKRRVLWKTILWDRADQARVRRDVTDALRREVAADWSETEVNDLVDEVLKEWREGDDDEEEDTDEDDEADDGRDW
jgi:excisionase family DNA binding protein